MKKHIGLIIGILCCVTACGTTNTESPKEKEQTSIVENVDSSQDTDSKSEQLLESNETTEMADTKEDTTSIKDKVQQQIEDAKKDPLYESYLKSSYPMPHYGLEWPYSAEIVAAKRLKPRSIERFDDEKRIYERYEYNGTEKQNNALVNGEYDLYPTDFYQAYAEDNNLLLTTKWEYQYNKNGTIKYIQYIPQDNAAGFRAELDYQGQYLRRIQSVTDNMSKIFVNLVSADDTNQVYGYRTTDSHIETLYEYELNQDGLLTKINISLEGSPLGYIAVEHDANNNLTKEIYYSNADKIVEHTEYYYDKDNFLRFVKHTYIDDGNMESHTYERINYSEKDKLEKFDETAYY